jgi:hypothetical protein
MHNLSVKAAPYGHWIVREGPAPSYNVEGLLSQAMTGCFGTLPSSPTQNTYPLPKRPRKMAGLSPPS